MTGLRLRFRRASWLGAVFIGLAGPASADDLISVYIKALDGNPEYQSAVAGYQQALEAKPQALAKLLPQIGLGGEVDAIQQSISGRYFVGSVAPNSPGNDINRSDQFYNYSYAVGLTQALFHRDLFINLSEADLEVSRASLLTFDAQDQLRLAVAETYFGALAADDEQRFTGAEKDAIAKLLDQTRDKAGSGLVADAEVKAAQAALDLANSSMIAAKNGVAVSRAQLELLTGGQKYGALKPLTAFYVPAPPDPDRIDDWIERASTQNLKLQAQRLGTQIAQKDLDRAYAQRWPTLDALASRNYAYADGGLSKGIGANSNHEVDNRVGIKLKIPIFTGGAIDSTIRYASAGLTRAKADEAGKRNEALRAVQVAFLNSSAGIAKVQALQRAIVSATAAEEATRVGYDVGTRTNADLLLAVRARYRAERDYATARYETIINTVRLRAAAGSLNHADLLAINRVLQ